MSAPLARLTAALADRYRIERELGAGGMATVYLAEDIKHDRKVAVKVLRPELAAVIGAERFVVEIKTTAALQHPHILPLFDSGESDGFLWYAMPFIDGETLRAKLDRETQLGIDEALKITTAVADALDYAHRHGVVHRDIKPENILLHDGRPMVADFGIALALSAAAGGRMTETGMSLGTPHYMSPEQATADKEISARSDVYSLGSVLYEMLAGQPPHLGGSAQQIIMKIIAEQAAPVTSLRKAVPPHVAAAVARSLEKLPADRFESARAFADALGNPGFTHGTVAGMAGGAHRTGSRWRDPLTVGLAACAVIATVLAGWAFGRPAATGPVGWYAVALDSTSRMAYGGIGELARLSLTPDGRTLVYVGVRSARGMELQRQLFVRRLGSLASQPIAGTEEGVRPAVSWDGAQVAFLTDRNNPSISVVSLGGGPVLTLVTTEVESGPAWGPDAFVYYLTPTGMIRRVAGSGGPTEDVVQLPAAPDNGEYGWLTILPGGKSALVGSRPTGNRFGEESQYWLVAVDLATGKLGETLQGLAARYVAEAKTMVYVAPNGSIMAVPYDLKAMRSNGRPSVLAAGGSSRSGDTDFDVAGGTLAYTEQGRNGTEYLAWVNRANGSVVPVDTAWHDTEFEAFALSPDGSRLAVTIGGSGAGRTQMGGSEQNNQTRYDVWIKQLDRGPISRRSFEGERNEQPSWSADGRFITYTSTREGKTALFRRRADGVGEEERIASSSDGNIIESRWSRDGRWLVASIRNRGSIDLMAMQLGVDTVLRPLLADPFFEAKPALSTDGAWLAYVSNESGTPQIFVRPFPNVTEGKWQISVEGGTDPVWRENGRELFFRSPDGNTVYAADMTRGPALAGVQRLFAAPATSSGFELNSIDRMFDVSPDGQRFLLSIDADLDASGNLVIVENFLTYLRDAMASGKANP